MNKKEIANFTNEEQGQAVGRDTQAETLALITELRSALEVNQGVRGIWIKLGHDIKNLYPTRKVLEAAKATFWKDVLVPAHRQDVVDAYMADIPRKGSVDVSDELEKEHAKAREKKVVARATIDSTWRRVLKYTFPSNAEWVAIRREAIGESWAECFKKEPGNARAATSTVEKLHGHLEKMRKLIQGKEQPPFEVNRALALLTQFEAHIIKK